MGIGHLVYVVKKICSQFNFSSRYKSRITFIDILFSKCDDLLKPSPSFILLNSSSRGTQFVVTENPIMCWLKTIRLSDKYGINQEIKHRDMTPSYIVSVESD